MDRTPIDPRANHKCRFCKYFDTVNNIEAKQLVSVCRRNAPSSTAQLMMVPSPSGGASPQWSTFTLWPIVGAEDWCGEFARDRSQEN